MHAEHADSARLDDLSGRVIDCSFTVPGTLGAGFLEKVYENALAQEQAMPSQAGERVPQAMASRGALARPNASAFEHTERAGDVPKKHLSGQR